MNFLSVLFLNYISDQTHSRKKMTEKENEEVELTKNNERYSACFVKDTVMQGKKQ